MPDPRPISPFSRSGQRRTLAHDSSAASAESTPRSRRNRLQRALQSTTELARDVASMVGNELIRDPNRVPSRRSSREASVQNPQRPPRDTSSREPWYSRRRQREDFSEQEEDDTPVALPEVEDDDRRSNKRRRIDSTPVARTPAFRYGHFGQVVSGKLRMEVVSCDGGEFIDPRHPQVDLGSKNVLAHDKAVYCSARADVIMILKHADDTPFTMDTLHIIGPEVGFSAPVRHGVAYVAMTFDDLQPYIDPLPQPSRRYAEPPPHAQRSVHNNLRRHRRDRSGGRDGLSLAEALRDSEINDALQSNQRQRATDSTRHTPLRSTHTVRDFRNGDRAEIRSVLQTDGPCDLPPAINSDEDEDVWATIDAWNNEAPYAVHTRLLSVGPGPEDPTDQAVADFRNHRSRVAHRRYELENWDRDNISSSRTRDDDRGHPDAYAQLEALMARSRVHDRDSGQAPPVRHPYFSNADFALENAAFDPNVTVARFVTGPKNSVAIQFEPEVSGRFILLKLSAGSGKPNVDVESIIVKGFAGPRFFPSLELR